MPPMPSQQFNDFFQLQSRVARLEADVATLTARLNELAPPASADSQVSGIVVRGGVGSA